MAKKETRTTKYGIRKTDDGRRSLIEVRFARPISGISATWVRNIVAETLKLECSSDSVSVYVTGNREIRRINRRFLKHDYATDVISFPLERRMGEIVVSAETARQTSEELGIPFREELARYLIHGTLHLLGYKDEKPADKKHMHKRQEALLKRVIASPAGAKQSRFNKIALSPPQSADGPAEVLMARLCPSQ